jgi:hypothetical protein
LAEELRVVKEKLAESERKARREEKNAIQV